MLAGYLLPTQLPGPNLELASTRYEEAFKYLGFSTEDSLADPILRFALSNPKWIGPLDAATALLARESPLRKRLILLHSILETLPDCAALYLPQENPRPFRSWFTLVSCSIVAGLKAFVGIPLFIALNRVSR